MTEGHLNLIMIKWLKSIKKKSSPKIQACWGHITKVDKPFQPARKLYLYLLCISVVLLFCSMNISIDSPWFTIMTGISCGGFSSTLVAWLIDEANSKQAREKATTNREMILKKLFSCFDNGLQLLIFCAKDYIQDEDARTWFSWIELLHDISKASPEFRKDYCQMLNVFFQDLDEKTNEILSQSMILLEYNILEETDIDILSSILDNCYISVSELHSKKSDEIVLKKIMTNATLIKKQFELSPSLQFINCQPIAPTIYKLAKDRVSTNNSLI